MSEQEKFPGVTHYTHVDVQPGGINIQHVEHLHQADVLQALGIELEVKRTKQTGNTETACPPQLDTPQARGLWQKAIAEGWVDERRQPLLSRPMAALLADRMATVLNITAKWKVFEQMWHRKNMRNDYNTALEQQQCDEYRKKFARVIR